MRKKFLSKLLFLYNVVELRLITAEDIQHTRMNFCKENSVNLTFLSFRLLSFSAVSLASRAGALTSLSKPRLSIFYACRSLVTHLRLTLFLIFLLRLSLVTNSSVSSLKAKCIGRSLIFRLTHSCFTTSSTVRVGSIRVRTVTPSPVVTVFVGTNVVLGWAPLGELGLVGTKGLRAGELRTEFDMD